MATTINLNGGEPIYLLLGEEASNIYEDEGFDELLRLYEENQINVSTYKLEEGGNVFDLLEAMDGYLGYTIITKEEYDKLL